MSGNEIKVSTTKGLMQIRYYYLLSPYYNKLVNILSHAVCCLIFIEHKCMVLFFNLDISQQFP